MVSPLKKVEQSEWIFHSVQFLIVLNLCDVVGKNKIFTKLKFADEKNSLVLWCCIQIPSMKAIRVDVWVEVVDVFKLDGEFHSIPQCQPFAKPEELGLNFIFLKSLVQHVMNCLRLLMVWFLSYLSVLKIHCWDMHGAWCTSLNVHMYTVLPQESQKSCCLSDKPVGRGCGCRGSVIGYIVLKLWFVNLCQQPVNNTIVPVHAWHGILVLQGLLTLSLSSIGIWISSLMSGAVLMIAESCSPKSAGLISGGLNGPSKSGAILLFIIVL